MEPADHAVGRSRGGLSTKIHHVCDGKGRPLVLLLGPGQGNDSPMFPNLLNAIRVPRLGRGRPRTRPDKVLGDKAVRIAGDDHLAEDPLTQEAMSILDALDLTPE